ncbi:phosphate acyltransferase PlsX [Methylosinus sp. Ce-a6]|uniref:phosphate acyltransferase PlsX n=1 Tax=Methylosinus sp. Ce-a6 TaxID=2172005 RepID=UPI001357EFA5|nr:phosphate acyltransferase PlsX [Methylosinus sp. Ce-a6]
MAQPIRIALDAMGGDHGPKVTIAGAAIAHDRHPDSSFLLYGDEGLIRTELAAHPRLARVAAVRHCDVAVRMDDKPSQALRAGRRVSSMWQAIEAVKKGEADVAVSAGNTGALMAMAKVCLHTMAKIERPALACLWPAPTARGYCIVLDVGASIGADARHLVDLAVMGAAMARSLFDIERPSVGLLNVGVEEIKGVEEVKTASRLLKEADLPDLDYHGFVEGDEIGKGVVDVVVAEGFTGNIALKTAEGTATQIKDYLRQAIEKSWLAKIGYLLARGAFRELREKVDVRNINGGVFLGLEGVVIKSHGGADALAFARAVEIGYEMAHQDLLSKIRDMLATSRRDDQEAAQ